MIALKKISRFVTREVNIGGVPLGSNFPIRIQSMTTTDTMNTVGTIEQCIRIIDAGSDYVRITAPSIKEANNLLNIKNELRKRGYKTPLIADIHFTPNAAETSARIVEKVRINPGNYADKKKFNIIDYSEIEYNNELERIYKKFLPLLKICKEYGTVIRIGTNHGSLSDRIMSRYGDTPIGMVESALEFARICVKENFHDIVFSMKASNPKIMIEANRLLVDSMLKERMNYPIHIGVTEAGDGEDGRIKSAIGIGTLLEEGIGDTIRVSLTEEPEFEIPVCKNLVSRYAFSIGNEKKHIKAKDNFIYYNTNTLENIGGSNPPVVIINADEELMKDIENFRKIGYLYSELLDKWTISDISPDYVYSGNREINFKLPGTLKVIYDFDLWKTLNDKKSNESYPLYNIESFINESNFRGKLNFLKINFNQLTEDIFDKINPIKNLILVLEISNETRLSDSVSSLNSIRQKGIKNPIIIKISYKNIYEEKWILYSSVDAGGLFVDGYGDGIWLISDSVQKSNEISFGILQATRRRISKTEYISCPSCGRTLFDLQETTAKIRSVTNHLKGVKIAIMGCIVNGPGEMADADFGYVGSGIGKITLYKGKDVVKKNVPAENAITELINLLKENNCWVEPD